MIEVANLSQARKREKEQAIKELVEDLDNHLSKCHLILHLKEQQVNLVRMHYSEVFQKLKSFDKAMSQEFVKPLSNIINGSL